MALTKTQQDRLDTLLQNAWTTIQAKQDAYFAGTETIREASKDDDGNDIPAVTRTRNRYWQGRRQPGVIPVDGAKSAPDLTDKPTDQAESWGDFGLGLPATIEASLQCDVYVAPKGPGYVVTATVVVGGDTWARAQAIGPESALRTFGWTKQDSGDGK